MVSVFISHSNTIQIYIFYLIQIVVFPFLALLYYRTGRLYFPIFVNHQQQFFILADITLLIETPGGRAWDIPFGTLPALTGHLRAMGHTVIQRDLNHEIILNLLEPGAAQKILSLLDQRADMIDRQLSKRRPGFIKRMKRLALRNARTLPFLKKLYFNFVSHQAKSGDTPYSLLWKIRNSRRKLESHLPAILTLRNEWLSYIEAGRYDYDLFTRLNMAYNTMLEAINNAAVIPGKNSRFTDFTADSGHNFFYTLYEDFFASIKWDEIKIAGITANVKTRLAALTLARIIRSRFPDVHVVIGGLLFHDAHFNDSHDVSDLKNIFANYAHFIVSGEGESALKAIHDYIDDKISWENVPNTLRLSEGRLLFNKPFHYEELSSLPDYDFEGLPVKFYSGLPVEVNRGCYWGRCTFCRYYHNYQHRDKYSGSFYRSFHVEHIISRIRFLVDKYGVSNFEFVCLDISPAEARKLSEGIISAGLDIKWNARVRLDKNFDPGLFHLMQESGATMFMFYPETFSKKVAALHNKNYDIDHVKSLISYWNDHKNELNPLVVKLMTGYPGESFADFMESLDYVKKNNVLIQNIGLFNLSKGSGVYSHPEKYGIKIHSVHKPHDIFDHYEHEWSPAHMKERRKIESWLFNNRKKWRKMCYGWSGKYKLFMES